MEANTNENILYVGQRQGFVCLFKFDLTLN